jgi:hypothetical protein
MKEVDEPTDAGEGDADERKRQFTRRIPEADRRTRHLFTFLSSGCGRSNQKLIGFRAELSFAIRKIVKKGAN